MNREQFMQEALEHYTQCINILKKKNADYASDVDALKNFRRHGIQGIVIRMYDKLSRVEELTSGNIRKPQVNESVIDTLRDLANYAVIAAVLWGESRSEKDIEEVVDETTPQLPLFKETSVNDWTYYSDESEEQG